MNEITVVLDKMDNVVCTSCDSPYFDVVYVLKFVPGLLIGQPNSIVKEVPLYRCVHCQHIRGGELWVKEKEVT